MKHFIKLVFLTTALMLVLAACGSPPDTPAEPSGELQEGTLNFEVLEQTADLPSEVKEWYDGTYPQGGLFSRTHEGQRYILLSAGERPTGGYAIEDFSLTGTASTIEVRAKLVSPGPNQAVTQALTYPHLLVKIPADNRELVGGFVDDSSLPLKTDSGTFVGLIDPHSLEIKISGVPEEEAARAFQMSQWIQEHFDQFGLATGDQVRFNYYENAYGQLILVRIENITH